MVHYTMTHDSNIGLIRHEDFIQPFTVNKSTVRGRMVRVGDVLDTILTRHDNHPLVNKLLGELLTLAAMLSANLPEDGILTMQAKGDGAIPFAVVDATGKGAIRGYADISEHGDDTLTALEQAGKEITLPDLMGKGYLAITLDMGFGDPYQGIVPLEGASMSEAVTNYCTQSQQIDVKFNIYVGLRERDDGTKRWRAGGLMLERIPEEGGNPENKKRRASDELSSWSYNALLIDTATEDELLDPHLAASALLYRLFNEGGVWAGDSVSIPGDCRCSREKIENVFSTMDAATLEDMKMDGVISVVCQFCNCEETFNDADIAKMNEG